MSTSSTEADRAEQTLEHGREPDTERGLGVGAEHEARQRDADLRRADIAVEGAAVLDMRKKPPGQPVAIIREPPDPAATHAHRRELAGDVQRVGHNEDGHDEPGADGHGD
jgi:hypothetical protein